MSPYPLLRCRMGGFSDLGLCPNDLRGWFRLMSCLAQQMRRHLMLPYARLPFGIAGCGSFGGVGSSRREGV